MAMARFWTSLGVKATYVIGHSLGEYAALQVAGVLSIANAIFLCGTRAVLIEARCVPDTHGMVSVKASQVQLAHIATETAVEVACINGPDETVLAGSIKRIDALCERLTELGHKFTKLPIPFAFHSSQVSPVLGEFEDIMRRVSFQTPTIPVVSTLLGTVVRDNGVFGPQYLRKQCREPVNFLGAIESAKQEGLLSSSVCVEIGTHPILHTNDEGDRPR